MNFFVYLILDPRKVGSYNYLDLELGHEPFYVGKGKKHRASIRRPRNNYCTNKINKIERLGSTPIVKVIKKNMVEEESFLLEKEIIKKIGRLDRKEGPLLNLTDGGEGCTGYNMPHVVKNKIAFKRIGCRHSEETKKRISKIKKSQKLKMPDELKERLRKINSGRPMSKRVCSLNSERMRGDKNPNWKGRSFTEERRNDMAERMTGENNPFFGKNHTEKTRKKLSEIAKSRTGEKNPFFGKKHKEITKEKISKFFRQTWILRKEKDEVVVDNLREFCSRNDLSYSNMRKAACGLIHSYKGWTVFKGKI